ncbi:MAG TPA: hypothetical protein VGF56_03760 [Rhizomicrobium sp.]
MKTILAAGAAALALVAAAPAWSDDAANDAGPAWFGAVADQKLIAVDGASITLSSADSKMTLTMASASGAAQKRVYVLMSDNMGTVSDDADRMLGFFRVTDTGLEEEFGDGHTEQLSLNGYGGLSLATHSGGATTCLAWYPAGHTFSEAERRAAVTDYANRLGLSQAKTAHVDSCNLVKSAAPISHVEHHMASAQPSGPIMVRTVTVHTIDPPAPATPKASWSAMTHAAVVQGDTPQPGHGASDCLHVESDGANLGFRNQCGYGVQFAYCLQSASETDANCGAGAKAGNVSANGFTPLLMDTNIKAADAEHDFRWVACSGASGEVTPQLDKPDPPAGRCLLKKS